MFLAKLISGFPPDSVHSRAALMERLIRVASLLCYGSSPDPKKLPPLRGRSGMGTIVSQMRRWSDSDLHPEAFVMASEVIQAYDNHGSTLPNLRNYLQHGGVAPSGSREAGELDRFNNEAIRSIYKFADSMGYRESEGIDAIKEFLPRFYPFILIEEAGSGLSILTFQSAKSKSIQYNSDDLENYQKNFGIGSPIFTDMIQYVNLEESLDSKDLGFFSRRVEDDVRPFTEPETKVHIEDNSSGFEVHWEWAQSSDILHRVDHFRLSAAGATQWSTPEGDWLPYDEFLRRISNWELSVRRYGSSLNSVYERMTKAQKKAQGKYYGTMNVPEGMPTRFRVVGSEGRTSYDADPNHPVSLEKLVDDYTTARNGFTQIFLVAGEAGVGKTHNLITEAIKRAKSIIATGDTAPLYLFVDCAGSGTRSLEALIDSSVSSSLNLDFKKIAALSRNGLCALVLDGFDELLGGSGYSDALSLLVPVLEKLGESGTVLVSARSSYIANQYEDSFRSLSKSGGPVPEHLKISLDRWKRTDVEDLFEANPSWQPMRQHLSQEDVELLGVPFFAQSFNAIVNDTNRSSSLGVEVRDSGLRRELIRSYLERELTKIPSADDSQFSVEMLELIYSEVAGMMWGSHTNSISLDDFLLAAALGLSFDHGFEDRYKSLGDRLTNLCGIQSSRDDDALGFGFYHQLFYDNFVGRYIAQRVMDGGHWNYSHLIEEISESTLGAAAVDSLCEIALQGDQGSFTTVLRQALDYWEFQHAGTSGVSLKENLSAIVAYFLDRDMFIRDHFEHLDFEDLVVGDNNSNLTFDGCSFASLSLTGGDRIGSVKFSNSTVEVMRIQSDFDFAHLSIDEASQIDEVIVLDGAEAVRYLDRSGWPQFFLEEGVCGLEDRVSDIDAKRDQPAVALAVSLFQKMNSMRRNNFVIDSRTSRPGDHATPWLPSPSSEFWPAVVSALVSSGAARRNSINASGSSKDRIQLEIAASDLLRVYDDRDGGHSGAALEFWNDLN